MQEIYNNYNYVTGPKGAVGYLGGNPIYKRIQNR